ncbi:MAG: Ig-like domain-containing protein, partial [Chloroflexi bacterium]|nr:Ig-like domain-containing protein [Chloroflexota bacterium]
MKRTNLTPTGRVTLIAGLITAIMLSACQPNTPTAAPTRVPPTVTPIPPTATALPPRINLPYTPVPLSVLSPTVIQHTPETGERLNPGGAIQIVFDRAMDQKSVESAFKVQPAVAGSFAWTDARTMDFKPSAPLPHGATIDVALTQDARAADGAMLRGPYQFRFATQGNLEVGQTIPAAGTADANPDTIITVLFNHPVVPLTTLNEQAGLPQPLSFDPPIAGKAEWLNTSILVFHPSQPLPGGTTYTGRIAASLNDTDGNPLAADYTWSFSTAAPKVLMVYPGQKDQPARIDSVISVVFNQNVDPASAQAAFALLDAGGRTVDGQSAVLSETFTFTPANRLAFDANYTIRVAAGVKSVGGGNGSLEAWNSTFRTVPLPKVIGTEPADGTRDAPPGTPFTIKFNTDIDPATIMAHFSMAPEISPTRVFSYYNSYAHSFTIYFGAQAATDYVAQITPGIADPYGNLTQQSLRAAFRTGDLPASAYLNVPYGAVTLNAYLPAQLAATTVNVSRLDLQLFTFNTQDAGFMTRDQNELASAPKQPVRSCGRS